MIHRRGFITGLVSLVTAPAIIRASSLMPIRAEVIAPIPYLPPSVDLAETMDELRARINRAFFMDLGA